MGLPACYHLDPPIVEGLSVEMVKEDDDRTKSSDENGPGLAGLVVRHYRVSRVIIIE